MKVSNCEVEMPFILLTTLFLLLYLFSFLVFKYHEPGIWLSLLNLGGLVEVKCLLVYEAHLNLQELLLPSTPNLPLHLLLKTIL